MAPSIEFNTLDNVVSGVEVTILSINNSSGDKNISSIIIEGNARADWSFYINTLKTFKASTSVANASKPINMYDYLFKDGDILDVKVIHNESSIAQFSCAVNLF